MRKTFIYGLYSTRNNIIRYVGKSNNMFNRLRHHIYRANYNYDNTHKSNWIRKEISDGYKIEYRILEECDYHKWEERECYWMTQFDDLTNTSKGGYGGSPLEYNISFDDLSQWVKDNLPAEIDTKNKWKSYIKENNIKGVPLNPYKVYNDKGWISWAFFLNSKHHNNKKDIYLSFTDFKKWLKENNIKTTVEFRGINKPIEVPTKPEKFYRDEGWISWYDVLPTSKNMRPNYLSYDECKKFLIENYDIKNTKDFRLLCRQNNLPNFIPKKPERVYKNFSFGDFLSTGNVRNGFENYISFEKARSIIRSCGLNTNRDWREFIKLGLYPDIPNTPEVVYKNKGWVSWRDWLGSDLEWRSNIHGLKSIEESKLLVISNNVTSIRQYKNFASINKELKLPVHPEKYFKNKGWISWDDFFSK